MRLGIRIKERNVDEAYTGIIMAYYFASIMFSVFTRVLEARGINLRVGLYLVGGFIILYNAKDVIISIINRKLMIYLLFVLPFSILFLISVLRGTDIRILQSHLFPAIALYMPMATCVYCIDNYSIMYQTIKKWCIPITVVASFIILVPSTTGFYTMNFSYVLLIAILVHINEAFKRNYWYIFLVVYELILNLVFGSRGSILCILCFLGLLVIFSNVKVLLKMIVIGTVTIFYVRLDYFGNIILALLKRFNIHSRTLTLLFTNRGYLSGREGLYELAEEMIRQKPIWGWGLGAEFYRIGNYPHNIVLEMMINYGQILGIIVFVLLVCIIIVAVLLSHSEHRAILLIFVAQGFVVLFISSSYLTWPGFYILMGIVLHTLKANLEIMKLRR